VRLGQEVAHVVESAQTHDQVHQRAHHEVGVETLDVVDFIRHQLHDFDHQVGGVVIRVGPQRDEVVQDLDDLLADGGEKDGKALVAAAVLFVFEETEHVVLLADGVRVDQVDQFGQERVLLLEELVVLVDDGCGGLLQQRLNKTHNVLHRIHVL